MTFSNNSQNGVIKKRRRKRHKNEWETVVKRAKKTRKEQTKSRNLSVKMGIAKSAMVFTKSQFKDQEIFGLFQIL